MPYSKDLVDALLMAHQTVGPPFQLHPSQVVFMKQFQGKFQQANSPDMGPAFQKKSPQSTLDAVIRREVLLGCVGDVSGAEEFDSWTWHGFMNGMSKVIGTLSARHIPTNTHCQHKFYMTRSEIDRCQNSFELQQLISLVDGHMLNAVIDIVASVLPPHDINTCTDPECNC